MTQLELSVNLEILRWNDFENDLEMTLKWPWNDLEMDADDLSGEGQVPPMKKLEDLIHLAELCVDLLQQNEEHYAEVNWNVANNESIN